VSLGNGLIQLALSNRMNAGAGDYRRPIAAHSVLQPRCDELRPLLARLEMSSRSSLNDVSSEFTGLAIPISLSQTNITEDQSQNSGPPEGSSKPKPTQIACTLCRRRKIKCDGGIPSCGRCTKLNSECTYHENRRKSGPRRGYVKGLETRLGYSSHPQ
jgi:hypothetical protein